MLSAQQVIDAEHRDEALKAGKGGAPVEPPPPPVASLAPTSKQAAAGCPPQGGPATIDCKLSTQSPDAPQRAGDTTAHLASTATR